MYKLLIIDDEPLVQAGINSMIAWESLDINVCNIASNGEIGLQMIHSEKPDIVITDLKMPVMTGLELMKAVREDPSLPYIAFIVLTSYEEFQLAKEAAAFQVIDYLVKLELTPDLLTQSIEKAISMIKKINPSNEVSKIESLSSTDINTLKNKFFIRLLHNLYDSTEQFQLLQKDLNISFSYQFFQCCYFELVYQKELPLTSEKQIALSTSAFQLLKRALEKYIPVYLVSLDSKHGVIILLYDTQDQVIVVDQLKEILINFSNSLVSYYNTSLTCGIGTVVGSPLEISDSYIFARHAFQNSSNECTIVDGTNNQTKQLKNSIFDLGILKNELSKAFSEYDSTQLTSALEQLILLFQEHPQNYIQALDAACNILFLTISLLPDGEACLNELFSDYPEGYRYLYHQTSTSGVISWILIYQQKICMMFEEHKKEHRHHTVDSVKKYIESHLNDRLSLNEVSTIFDISPGYLSFLFKKYNAMGYSEYVTKRKINKAKELLHSGSYKVYEVSEALGFENSFYFSKVFKKLEGITPTEYMNH